MQRRHISASSLLSCSLMIGMRERKKEIPSCTLLFQCPCPHFLIWEEKERRWQPTQALVNPTSNFPVFTVHIGEEVTGSTWIKAHRCTVCADIQAHACAHKHTHTHCTCPLFSNLLLKSSPISHSCLHCKLPQPTLKCVYVCACVTRSMWVGCLYKAGRLHQPPTNFYVSSG